MHTVDILLVAGEVNGLTPRCWMNDEAALGAWARAGLEAAFTADTKVLCWTAGALAACLRELRRALDAVREAISAVYVYEPEMW